MAHPAQSLYAKTASLAYHFQALCLAVVALAALAFATSPIYMAHRATDAYIISGLVGGPIALLSFLGSLRLYTRHRAEVQNLVAQIRREGFSASVIARSRIDPEFARRLTLAAIRLGKLSQLEAALRQ